MTVQPTSIEAYHSIKDTLSKSQADVLEALIRLGPSTNRYLSKCIGKEINTVTPRIKELRDRKLVKQTGTTIDITGRRAIVWAAIV